MKSGLKNWLYINPFSQRQWILMLSLLASLALSAWVNDLEQSSPTMAALGKAETAPMSSLGIANADLQQSKNSSPEQSNNRFGNAPLDLARLSRRKSAYPAHDEIQGTDIDAFRTKSWFVPPPPPPPEPPSKPAAPALPFQFVGKTEAVDGSKQVVFLAHTANSNEFYSVSRGDRFAENYRLEKVEPNALIIRYLPLSINQSLPISPSE